MRSCRWWGNIKMYLKVILWASAFWITIKYCEGNCGSTKEREFVHLVNVYQLLNKMLLRHKSLVSRIWCVNFLSYNLDFWLVNKLLNYLITTVISPERSDSSWGLHSLQSNICRNQRAGTLRWPFPPPSDRIRMSGALAALPHMPLCDAQEQLHVIQNRSSDFHIIIRD
jgi:hypothetical protein